MLLATKHIFQFHININQTNSYETVESMYPYINNEIMLNDTLAIPKIKFWRNIPSLKNLGNTHRIRLALLRASNN